MLYSSILSIKLSFSLIRSLNMNEAEFRDEVKKLSLIKQYELGKLSSGKAA